jgi:hypothetical protein
MPTDRLGSSPEGARSLARRLRSPRTTGNDGKARVTVDLADIQYKPLPARPPGESPGGRGRPERPDRTIAGGTCGLEAENAEGQAEFERRVN